MTDQQTRRYIGPSPEFENVFDLDYGTYLEVKTPGIARLTHTTEYSFATNSVSFVNYTSIDAKFVDIRVYDDGTYGAAIKASQKFGVASAKASLSFRSNIEVKGKLGFQAYNMP